MGLLEPLALLALPLAAFIVFLYLLRYRRPFAPVGSLFLWSSLTRDREANTLWQRLHVSALLILQLLALLALIFALARPWLPATEAVGQNAVIVMDVSASMGATDGSANGHSTRLDAAKNKAHDLIDSLPQGATAALISSDVHATILVPPTDDKSRLREAVDRLAPQPSGTDMGEALQLASALAARQSNSTLWVLSDGVFPASGTSRTVNAQVHFVKMGTRGSNQGITAMSVTQQGGSPAIFLQLTNSDVVTVARRLDLSVDDSPWNARTVALAPGETQQLVIDDLPLSARVVEAHLSGVDDLAIDDSAWTVNRASVPGNVLLVSEGDKFLELAVGLLPNVSLYKVPPTQYDPSDIINGAAPDLTIFDSDVPTDTLQKLPQGNLLFVGPRATTSLFKVAGQVDSPQPSFASTSATGDAAGNNTRDPLLRFVDLSTMHVAKSFAVTLPEWAHAVLDSDKGPLILTGDTGGRRVSVISFDLHDSDLPLLTAFPLLVRNIVTYLLPDPSGAVPAQVAPEDVVQVAATDKTVDKLLIEDPSAKEWTYALTSDRRRIAFAETARTGVYYITQYAGKDIVSQEAFAVNLASHDEAMITPNSAPGLPKGTTNAPQAAQGGQGPLKHEIWPYVALAGIAVLIFEWLFAQRVVIRRAYVEWRARRAQRRLGSL